MWIALWIALRDYSDALFMTFASIPMFLEALERAKKFTTMAPSHRAALKTLLACFDTASSALNGNQLPGR